MSVLAVVGCQRAKSRSVQMIQVKSWEEAVEWAKRCPGRDDEVIEVRQVQEFAGFPADIERTAASFREMQSGSK
jgi:hypothetical protein